MSSEQTHQLRFRQFDHHTCRFCGKKGLLVRGQLINIGAARSTTPFNSYVTIGPYCREHGGRARVEMEMLTIEQEPHLLPYVFGDAKPA